MVIFGNWKLQFRFIFEHRSMNSSDSEKFSCNSPNSPNSTGNCKIFQERLGGDFWKLQFRFIFEHRSINSSDSEKFQL